MTYPISKEFNNFTEKNFEAATFIQYFKNRPKPTISAIHLNIRSINANILELNHYLGLTGRDFDLIMLTECWLTEIDMFKELFPNYNAFISNKTNKAGGVILLTLKDTINIYDCHSGLIKESDSLIVKFNFLQSQSYTLMVIYRSPSADFNVFLESLHSFLTSNSDTKMFAVIGDFNVCLKKYSSNHKSEFLYDTLLETGFIPLIHSATRKSVQTDSIIDQMFLNQDLIIACAKLESGNVNCRISDHEMQYVFLDMNYNIHKNKRNEDTTGIYREKRLFNRSNIEIFLKKLSTANFDTSNCNNDLNKAFDSWQDNIYDIYKKTFPIIKDNKKVVKNKALV